MRLESRLIQARDADLRQRDAMFALMERHYLGMRREEFESDLDEKRWVIQLVEPGSGEIHGFSTQRMLEAEVAGRRIRALFSGDTIVDPRFWGNNNFIQAWGRLALGLIDGWAARDPESDLYWLLITKGYKTYRFLPVFFDEFYPRHDRATAARAGQALDALARGRWGARYDASRGTLRAEGENPCRLREEVAPVTDARLGDPHVRFFLERNPGYSRGEELCCIAPLTRANFTRAAYRAIGAELAPSEAALCP